MGCLNGEVIVIKNVALIHVVDLRASMGYNLCFTGSICRQNLSEI
jgi:hypothetical protein